MATAWEKPPEPVTVMAPLRCALVLFVVVVNLTDPLPIPLSLVIDTHDVAVVAVHEHPFWVPTENEFPALSLGTVMDD